MYTVDSKFFEVITNSTKLGRITEIKRKNDKVYLIVREKVSLFGIFSRYKKISEHVIIVNQTNLMMQDSLDDFSINFTEYSDFVWKPFTENSTDDTRLDILHCAVGMSGETGEIMEHIKKHVYHSEPLDKSKFVSELGDNMWYFTALIRLLGIKFTDILKANHIKLTTRYKDGRGRNYLINKNTQNEDELINKQLYANANS